MDKQVIDPRVQESCIPSYVGLRNRHAKALLTAPVTVEETTAWLFHKNVEVRCIIEGGILLGAVVLYLNKEGEIAFFVDTPNKGTGTHLLRIIEPVARTRGLKEVWSWVAAGNLPAQKAFLKAGYSIKGESEKKYKDVAFRGTVFNKDLSR